MARKADQLISIQRAVQAHQFYGEFDPGSGRTLAACLIHASRARAAGKILREATGESSGGRVSNTWATCPVAGDNSGKPGLIPNDKPLRMKGF